MKPYASILLCAFALSCSGDEEPTPTPDQGPIDAATKAADIGVDGGAGVADAAGETDAANHNTDAGQGQTDAAAPDMPVATGDVGPDAGAVTFPGSGALREVTGFGSNPGALKMFEYIPDGLAEGSPLVVVIHGCTQDATDADDEQGWLALADEFGFALVFPESEAANGCYGIENGADTARGSGDAGSIAQMTSWMESTYRLDPTRTFVAGFSSGGGMTNSVLAVYPDVFEAGASHVGVPYRCASGQVELAQCTTLGGRDLSPAEWAQRVTDAMPSGTTWPRVYILHGTADNVSPPLNMTEQMEQWTTVHGGDQIAETSDEVSGYPHRTYDGASGTAVVETLAFTGLEHYYPVDAQSGCGIASSAGYTQDIGFCASREILRFFGIAP